MGTQSSDSEWTIHSLNIHGLFFERWCEHIATASGRWRKRAVRLPVEFPPPNGPWRGKEGELDIWLEADVGPFRAHLLVECKKNNPDFVDWVFFRKPGKAAVAPLVVECVETEALGPETKGWRVQRALRGMQWTGPATDDGRETRGNYSQVKNDREKTKTANASIAAAAHQVALSAKSVADDEAKFSEARGRHASAGTAPWTQALFFPVIVTTANLFVCDFDAADVSGERGEVALSKATLSPAKQLLYEYALPRHLQSRPADLGALTEEGLDAFWRMHMIVVQSGNFSAFLEGFMAQAPIAKTEVK